MFTGGNVVYVAYVQYMDPVPLPSIADVGYLGAYPFFVVAVVLLARAEVGTSRPPCGSTASSACSEWRPSAERSFCTRPCEISPGTP